VVLADTRYSVFHLPLQLLFLWDFHVLALLERWQRDFGARARGWLGALGDLEALAALAGLAHDNPGWAFPRVAEREAQRPATLEARGLGHPLLAAGARVPNDVTLGPPGTFLLVTGSNMSGKSTLLRAIGVNVVLAQAGGPVCAESLALPPLDLATSLLIEDSLADGISFFMAELLRIRQVVDAADRAESAGNEGRVLLYLLDEILRGTNTRERQIAVRRVLGHLLSQGALGAVSTHDLELAEIPELAAACRPVHFRESLAPEAEREGQPVMTFDYKLREGVATTANALQLLDLVGLGGDALYRAATATVPVPVPGAQLAVDEARRQAGPEV
jgi:DNA mismatch repair ATPase MutS